MTEISTPAPLTARFAAALRATKADFVITTGEQAGLAQHGSAVLDTTGFPGWPTGLGAGDNGLDDAVIETFFGSETAVTPLGENQPYVSAWLPLAGWMNETVRRQLSDHAIRLDGDAYITASLTATSRLEGLAHMDDDIFIPTDTVSMVAIMGELAGPRVATGTIAHDPLRPMSQVTFSDDQLVAFGADGLDRCRAAADQLVVFPQFGQLHAGPAAHHVAHLARTRQLLVMRAHVQTSLG